MRPVICISITIASLAAIQLAAQKPPAHGLLRAVDPVELSGPPKKDLPLTPAQRAVAQSEVWGKVNSKDPSVLKSVLGNLTSFIQQDPTDSDLFLLRATVSCEIAGSNKNAMLNDTETSIKLWTPNENRVFNSLDRHYGLKAKIDFLLGRYADALNDLDAGMRIDYDEAEDMFNNGNVKPDEPTTSPCMWSQADVSKLTELFPRDYRSSLYVGLYGLEFSRWSLDTETDYKSILKAFEHAAELDPSSPLPSYFSATPYVMGNVGGLMSHANAVCSDDVVPRTEDCLALDDIHRTGVRFLTKSIAADRTFEPAYALRALAHLELREYRQAVRDYTEALRLDPNAKLYGDRALAETELGEYQAAILDHTKRIAQGCENSLCFAYENRANVYLKLRDYPNAISDIGHTIRNFLVIHAFNIDQFRRMYPEYDDVADDALCEKLRTLFDPGVSHADYCTFLVDVKESDDFVLPELFLKRGDAYADMGDIRSANREYDRVAAGFPKWAKIAFEMRNGKRVRVRH